MMLDRSHSSVFNFAHFSKWKNGLQAPLHCTPGALLLDTGSLHTVQFELILTVPVEMVQNDYHRLFTFCNHTQTMGYTDNTFCGVIVQQIFNKKNHKLA
jgi:hypothetical protein